MGGGYLNRGLSDGALKWMLDQLKGIGLVASTAKLNPPLAPNPLDTAQDDGQTFPFKDTPRSGRAFPECAAPSQSLRTRWGQSTEMLPSTQPVVYTPKGSYAEGTPLLSAPAAPNNPKLKP